MEIAKPTYHELVIRTEYDGKDLTSVLEIFFYDEEGEEQTCVAATNACLGLNTCADQGDDTWGGLKQLVVPHLAKLGISYGRLYFEDDRADCGYPTGEGPPKDA